MHIKYNLVDPSWGHNYFFKKAINIDIPVRDLVFFFSNVPGKVSKIIKNYIHILTLTQCFRLKFPPSEVR